MAVKRALFLLAIGVVGVCFGAGVPSSNVKDVGMNTELLAQKNTERFKNQVKILEDTSKIVIDGYSKQL